MSDEDVRDPQEVIDQVVEHVLSGRPQTADISGYDLFVLSNIGEDQEVQRWHFVAYPDACDFDPEVIDGLVSEERMEQLVDEGAEPSEGEMRLFREAYVKRCLGDDTFEAAVAYPVQDTQERTVYVLAFVSGHSWDGLSQYWSDQIFPSLDAIKEHLRANGDFL